MLALDESESSGSSSSNFPSRERIPGMGDESAPEIVAKRLPFSESNWIDQPEKTMVTLGWRVNVSQNLSGHGDEQTSRIESTHIPV